MQALTKLNPTDPVRFDSMNAILGEIEARDEDLLNKINELSEADVDLLDKINVLEGSKLSNTSIFLTRTESTTEQAIYTCPIDLEIGKIYNFATGASPSGAVKTIILRCNLGDYTFKISNTNTVDTMQNATWGDFNAGTKANMFLVERNGVKGAVIVSVPYSTKYFATTEKTSFLCTAQAGCTIVSQNCYTLNGEFCIELRIKKIDGSTFISGETVVAMLPLIPVAVYPCCVTARAGTSSWNLFAHAYIGTNKEIRVCCNNGISSGVTELFITCKGGVA